MTPNNIAGMGVLNGLQIMALTDHNTSKNCPAFFSACKKQGIIPIAGMELTTSEDVHIVCLFDELEDAMNFDEYVYSHIMDIKNKPRIFGNQFILDENDEKIGEVEKLLISATDISIDEAIRLVSQYGGVCYPAHVDRQSNGIIAMLGDIPQEYGFKCIEFNDSEKIPEYRKKYIAIRDANVLTSSDAHYLWDINGADNALEIEDEPYSGKLVTHNLLFNIIK